MFSNGMVSKGQFLSLWSAKHLNTLHETIAKSNWTKK